MLHWSNTSLHGEVTAEAQLCPRALLELQQLSRFSRRQETVKLPHGEK